VKALAFWAACAAVLFSLQLVVLHFGIHRKNWCFTAWLASGVAVQLLAACLYAAHSRTWLPRLGWLDEWLSLALAIGAVFEALVRGTRTSDQVQGVIVGGLVAILMVNAMQGLAARHGYIVTTDLWAWFRNIGFFGPAMWMLLSFSNVEGLPARIARMADFRLQISEVFGFARSILG
jgi:hypothetical protein